MGVAARPEGERKPEHERQDHEHRDERLHRATPSRRPPSSLRPAAAHCFIAFRIPRSSSCRVAGPTMCPTAPRSFLGSGTTLPLAIDEERLREPGDAVVAEQRPFVGDHRVVDPEPLHELRRGAAEILFVHAEEHDGLARPRLRRRGDDRRLVRARRAVGLPEVEHHDLAAERGEAQRPGLTDELPRERVGGDDLLLVELARDPGWIVEDLVREQPEQREDEDDADGLGGAAQHQTM